MYLRTPFGKNKIEQFTILGNGIEWIFPGKQQKYLGKHSLTLVINEDADDMITTDACNFVNLVACSCDVGGTPDLNVEVETIELTSVVEFNYDDTEIRQELAKKVNKEDIPEWINDAVIISPLSDSLAIIKAFNDYNLSSKKGQVLLSFVKRERFYEEYEPAALVVEDYNSEGAGWRLTFTLFGTSVSASPSDMEAIYSNNVLGSTKVLSFLYNKNRGYVIPLGEGEVKNKGIENKVNKKDVATINGRSIIDGGNIKIDNKPYDDTELKNEIAQNTEEIVKLRNEIAKVYDASVKFIEVDADVFYGLVDRDLPTEEFERVFGDTFKTINPNSVYYLKRTSGNDYETLILLYIYNYINAAVFVFGFNFVSTNIDLAEGVSISYSKDTDSYFISIMQV